MKKRHLYKHFDEGYFRQKEYQVQRLGMTWMFEKQKVTAGVWTGEGENGRGCVESVGPIV